MSPLPCASRQKLTSLEVLHLFRNTGRLPDKHFFHSSKIRRFLISIFIVIRLCHNATLETTQHSSI